MNSTIVTPEGLDKLKTELEYLKTEKRKQVSDRIKTAKEFGDLSENAEYQEAKDEQAFTEGKILNLENLIKTAVVADKNDDDQINVGNTIKVDREGQTFEFTIVGSTEGDPSNGKISVESPLGQAFVGKRLNEEFVVDLPAGKIQYKILEIK
ncbi:MAG: Transcription elongation factor GreA [Parcubacteria group bacterium GW2011_GWA2_36_10]|nr:MAG: Transcription elongation factor GreA [Parcubacteria group bacterium GW2011_GWA2_36_10]